MSPSLLCTCLRPRLALANPAALARLAARVGGRSLHAPATAPMDKRIPAARGSIKTTADLLAATKRKFGSYESKLGDWNSLFSKTGGDLRDVGMSVSDRRYLLWILEKFRQGHDLSVVARAPTPKKKVRGWGPKVQNGIRIR